jgi:hypothetical protein
MPPGSLIFTGEQKMPALKITVIDYDDKSYYEKEINNFKFLIFPIGYA